MLSKCGDEKLQSHKINKQTKKKNGLFYLVDLKSLMFIKA